MEHLYMDVLYTIKYKVGADTELSAHRDQLYVYAQKAFDVTPEQHRRYMAIVHEEKVSFSPKRIYVIVSAMYTQVSFRSTGAFLFDKLAVSSELIAATVKVKRPERLSST